MVAGHGADPRAPALREILGRIRSSRRLRGASEWVRALSVSAHRRLSAGLITHGVLVRTPRRVWLPTRSARRYDLLRSERRDAAVPGGDASFERTARDHRGSRTDHPLI
ncbi:GPP34 family phosphoprotein [Streptomyces mutabilis]|uniref:GPP34 family phosphoprotein n=1 Tax=Streptomyces mutabilis TaxID=67332 RepID=UPI00099C28A1